MKTIIFAAAAALASLTATVASAENPNFGIPAELQQNATPAHASSYGAPSVSIARIQSGDHGDVNPAANRFGDAQAR